MLTSTAHGLLRRDISQEFDNKTDRGALFSLGFIVGTPLKFAIETH